MRLAQRRLVELALFQIFLTRSREIIVPTPRAKPDKEPIAEIRIAGSIGVPKLKPAHIGGLGISRNADDCAAVGSGITNGYGSFEAGNKTFKGVCAGVCDSAK